MGMTNGDDVHLAKLQDHYARHRAMPSYGEMKDVLGFGSKAPAHKLAARLKELGILQDAPGGKLAPTRKFFARNLVRTPVRAGVPDTAETEVDADLVALDQYLIDHPSDTVLVRIKGDSMQDAGILEGDLAVVRRGAQPQAGDFVVAAADDGFAVKELKYDRGQAILVPHNSEYPILRPTRSLEIYGVVTGIVRRYGRVRSVKAES
jgi:SOS-response transcriptional repressor LexA